MRSQLIALSVVLFGAMRTMSACSCDAATSACREVAAGSTIFIGTAESISPKFLDHWSGTRRPALSEIIVSDDRFLTERSEAAFDALKYEFRRKLPDLAPDLERRLTAAKTHDAIVKIYEDVLDRGRIVRFHLQTVFNRGGEPDDDHDADEDGEDAPKSIEIKTPFDDCGYQFQTGETYLVYAVSDEDQPLAESDTCPDEEVVRRRRGPAVSLLPETEQKTGRPSGGCRHV